ncbi:MAG: hypothetical protein A2Z45_00790 [Chloroflexi bacterium RBG_19FT_COMBO_55_16]|nr:MAG: hypothetical protein A2Z45_00790 [Chloroflexi bacterium RBG_19FT_COMBO_55_16]
MKRESKLLILISLLTVFAFSCQILTNLPDQVTITDVPEITSAPIIVEPTGDTSQTDDAPIVLGPAASQDLFIRLFENINPGVVAIQVLTQSSGGLGSGFVIDKEGHILTNYHVIEGFTDLEVDFPSGFKTRGEVIGTDLDSDLAVIKVTAPPEELHPLPLGDSSQLKVGQTVIAIGNPFGLSSSMTTGIISALGRTLDSMHAAPGGATFSAGDIIQTDTAINPGNSGGPLLNLNGEVVGVNRAIRTFNFTSQAEPLNSGIGFAIAINIVKRVVPALIADGKYEYPYLGVSSLPSISLMEQEALGLPRSTGAYITEVTPGGPADKAGLRGGFLSTDFPNLAAGGDLIIAIDDHPVLTFSEMLSYLINSTNPGDTVKLTILRDNKELELELTLDKRP